MWLFVAGLVVVVVFLANRTNDLAAGKQEMSADNSVPALGVRETLSPASGNGNPLMSQMNNIRMGTQYHGVGLGLPYYRRKHGVAPGQDSTVGFTDDDHNQVPQQPALIATRQVLPRTDRVNFKL